MNPRVTRRERHEEDVRGLQNPLLHSGPVLEVAESDLIDRHCPFSPAPPDLDIVKRVLDPPQLIDAALGSIELAPRPVEPQDLSFRVEIHDQFAARTIHGNTIDESLERDARVDRALLVFLPSERRDRYVQPRDLN